MPIYCPLCDGVHHDVLGALGNLQYLRCCDCHATFKSDAEIELDYFASDDEDEP